jgi:tRNA-specific 2-thiouridylase
MKKVIIGLSGGVDSSYSAYLLKKEGYEVEGVYLKLHGREKYFIENRDRVLKVGEFLNIPIHILDLQNRFRDEVYQPFINSYISGETPNPCINCNREIKFGEFFNFAESLGADFIATGHYLQHDGKFLYEAEDKSKDQSYFLFDIRKEIVTKLLFPLGNMRKEIVKIEAKKIPQLYEIASQKESSEICFVENSYIDILKKDVNIDFDGDVLNRAGEVVGKHNGYMHYTIGKRRGFTLKVAHEPHYVLEIISEKNQIVVGKREELAEYKVNLRDLNMFILEKEFSASVKLRFRSRPLNCFVKISGDSVEEIELEQDNYLVHFHEFHQL